MPRFTFLFRERSVSYPVFRVEAETLEEAGRIYRRRSEDGDDPDSDTVGETELIGVYQDGVMLPCPETLDLVDALEPEGAEYTLEPGEDDDEDEDEEDD